MWHIKKSIKIIESGVVLLIFALFPYIAVGKTVNMLTFSIADYDQRNALLVGLPISLILIGSIMAIATRLKSLNFLRISIAILISMFIMGQVNSYILFQAQWVKELSIISNIRQQPSRYLKYDVLYVEDGWNLNPKYPNLFAFYDYKWTHLFKLALSPADRFPLAEPPSNSSEENRALLHSNLLSPTMCIGKLAISQGVGNQVIRVSKLLPKEAQLAIVHWKYRVFGEKDNEYSDWLRSLSYIQIIPESCTATFSYEKT